MLKYGFWNKSGGNVSNNKLKRACGKGIIELMDSKQFEEITIIDICNQSNIGRSTYYRHFKGRQGMINAIEYYFLSSWLNYEKTMQITNKELEAVLLDFLYKHQKEIITLSENNLSYIIDNIILNQFLQDNYPQEEYYIRHIRAGIWIGIVHSLINKKFSDSPDTVSLQIFNAIIKGLNNENEEITL